MFQLNASNNQTFISKIKNIRHLKLFIFLFVLLIFIGIGINHTLSISRYDLTYKNLPVEFDGLKIVQISDLHCKTFGKDQKKLINAVKKEKPDLIFLTGDLIDNKHTDLTPVSDLLSGLYDVAPMLNIYGNNEYASQELLSKLEVILNENQVIDMNNKTYEFTRNRKTLHIYGINYISQSYGQDYILSEAKKDEFNILLMHGADYFDYVNFYEFDLAFSGHVHGGIIRLPFIGGLISNDGSFLPPYTDGLYTKNRMTMVVSRGLGDAKLPRFYNRPDLVVVTLNP